MVEVTDSGIAPPRDGLPRLDQVLDHLALAVIATDRAGSVCHWNARAVALHGWTADEALGRDLTALTVPAEGRRAATKIMEAAGRGEGWQGPARLRRKDGSLFTAFLKSSPIRAANGEVIGLAHVSIELTDAELNRAMRTSFGNGRRTPAGASAGSVRESVRS